MTCPTCGTPADVREVDKTIDCLSGDWEDGRFCRTDATGVSAELLEFTAHCCACTNGVVLSPDRVRD